VGNIFFSGCNLACVYCQNWQASQCGAGDIYTHEQVADMMLKFQDDGIESVGLVTPSHQVPSILKALNIAVERGFDLPLIYNTNSFDNIRTLKLLDGVIDVYLADIRYSDNKTALKYSFAEKYVETSRIAVEEMFRQVGPFRGEAGSETFGGLIARVLVLPDNLGGVWETLCYIALELSKKIPISLMSQYRPIHEVGKHPELDRFITELEYNDALKMAKDLSFETIYTQELDPERHLAPDFNMKTDPFGKGL
jgi:putative pyruvate formate lyase activating enzyme